MSKTASRKRLLIHILLIAGIAITVFPFLWMVFTSFKTLAESMKIPPAVLPEALNTESYQYVWDVLPFGTIYTNTIIVTIITVLVQVAFCTMAAYGFARIDFPFKNAIFLIILSILMVPGQIFIIPQYLMISKMGMMNTTFALVFPGLVTAFGTYLLKTGYEGLPKDLEEAAGLDGCNVGQRFLKIMMPLTRSSMVSLGIFTAVFAFKDLMWPMIVCTKAETTTLSAALAKMQGQFTSDYPSMMAAAVLAVVPMIIIYVIFQKQFVEGIATSGGKL